MRLKKMKCDSCGAELELNLDHLQAFCPYCGTKLYIETDQLGQIITEKEKTKRVATTEEHKTIRKQMSYEHKSRESDKERKSTARTLIGCFAVLFFCVFLAFFMSHREEDRRDKKKLIYKRLN